MECTVRHICLVFPSALKYKRTILNLEFYYTVEDKGNSQFEEIVSLTTLIKRSIDESLKEITSSGLVNFVKSSVSELFKSHGQHISHNLYSPKGLEKKTSHRYNEIQA